MHIGIDASNIRRGGGITHLSSLLAHAEPGRDGFERISLWGTPALLEHTPDRPWLRKHSIEGAAETLAARLIWQQTRLPQLLKTLQVTVLFSPGGTLPWAPGVPSVTMSQNLLPFDQAARSLYPFLSGMRLKMALLRKAQARSLRTADGVIFLTDYARTTIQGSLRQTLRHTTIIPHGIAERFSMPPRATLPPAVFSTVRPFRLLYVSIVDLYKHQDQVAQAVALARSKGLPVSIDFVGPAYAPALERLMALCRQLDPGGEFLHYRGAVSFEQLHAIYREANAFVFASSCENLPNILIEAMAAGLPIACSSRGPMPEVLGEAGLYFDPMNPAEICEALTRLLADPSLRAQLAQSAWQRAVGYSWPRCASETFAFIREVADGNPVPAVRP